MPGSSSSSWRGQLGGGHSAEACPPEGPWLLTEFDDANDEEQHRCLQEPLLAGPPLAEDVQGSRDLRHQGHGMPLPHLVVFKAVGGYPRLPAKVDEEDRRPYDLQGAALPIPSMLVAVEGVTRAYIDPHDITPYARDPDDSLNLHRVGDLRTL